MSQISAVPSTMRKSHARPFAYCFAKARPSIVRVGGELLSDVSVAPSAKVTVTAPQVPFLPAPTEFSQLLPAFATTKVTPSSIVTAPQSFPSLPPMPAHPLPPVAWTTPLLMVMSPQDELQPPPMPAEFFPVAKMIPLSMTMLPHGRLKPAPMPEAKLWPGAVSVPPPSAS